jgi:membrane protein
MRSAWTLLRATFAEFFADNALSHGAAIAFYTIFALAPVLVVMIAVAGIVFGSEAAEGQIVGQLSGLMGVDSARAIENMLRSVSQRGSGIWATVLGTGALLLTATGVFGEVQTSLNAIWKATPSESAVGGLIRTRLLSLALVTGLGLLLLVSLLVSAALRIVQTRLTGILPQTGLLVLVTNDLVAFVLIAVVFATIYKVLPDTWIAWRDALAGALATSVLFSIGRYAIGLYIGSNRFLSSFGAASAVIVVLLWIYYSAQIFLLGAEFSKVYAAWRTQPLSPTDTEADPHRMLTRLKARLSENSAHRGDPDAA